MNATPRVASGSAKGSSHAVAPAAVFGPPHALDRGAVFAVLALALLVRIVEALRTPLAFDEIYALLLARMGPAGIFHVLREDVDQPLGFLVTWAWRALGGEGELWLKLPSIGFGLATILAVILLGRALFDARAGLWAGVILAANPSHIYYSQQASFPVLVWLLLTLTLCSAWRWIAFDERRDGVAFLAFSALAIFTYYFSAIVVAAVILWGAVRLRRARQRLLRWLGLGLALAALCAPSVPIVFRQLARDIFGDLSLTPIPAGDLVDFARKLADDSLPLVLPFAALAALSFLRREQWRNASLPAFAILLPVLVTFEMSREGIHVFILRQWLFALPLWALLLGSGLSRLHWRKLSVAAGAAIVVLGLRAWFTHGTLEEARLLSAVSNDLAGRVRGSELVLCADTRSLLYLHYHEPQLSRLRLLVVKSEEPFHYSDGILAVPAAWQMPDSEWRQSRERGERWWGVRLRHAGRDGPLAAALFDSLARGAVRRIEKVTWWEGAAPAP